MDDPVYCLKCRKQIDPADTFCRSCGADQRPPHRQTGQPSSAPPPSPAPSPVPLVTSVPMPQQHQYVLDEMARQYRGMTLMQLIGILFVPLYFVGLVIIVYAMVQKPAFRRKVAEMGYDPEAWERPLRDEGVRLCLIAAAVLVVAFVLWYKLVLHM